MLRPCNLQYLQRVVGVARVKTNVRVPCDGLCVSEVRTSRAGEAPAVNISCALYGCRGAGAAQISTSPYSA